MGGSMSDLEAKGLRWLADGDCCRCSKTMVFWLIWGIKPDQHWYPDDPHSFDRCLKLLEAAPPLRSILSHLAELSGGWARLVTRWKEIEHCFLDEAGLNWSKARYAPRTADLIKRVLAAPTDNGERA